MIQMDRFQDLDTRYKSSSHTLTEFFIFILLVDITYTGAVPGFSRLIQDRCSSRLSRNIASIFNLPRSETINRGDTVFIATLNDGNSSNIFMSGFWNHFDPGNLDNTLHPVSSEDITVIAVVGSNNCFSVNQFNSRNNLPSTASILIVFCSSNSNAEKGYVNFPVLFGRIMLASMDCS